MTTDAEDAIQYLDDQLRLFADKNSVVMGQLLELTVAQITFMQLIHIQFADRLEEMDFNLIRSHQMKTLSAVANMLDMPVEDIDHIIKKSMELVDCMQAMTDPTRTTNLH